MKTSKDFDDKMQELTAGVLSANRRKERRRNEITNL